MARNILHVDQNCFFASVEMIAHPECRNVPMAVVGDVEKRHGIVLAKNLLAGKAGVKTAEAVWQAELKCPGLVKLPAHYDKYQFYSERLRELYYEYTDLVEPFGMDECWLDITDSPLKATPHEIADEIRERVKAEFGLTCSVGVSFNKIFAKLGSDYKKPDATTEITLDNFKEIVWTLPASDLLYVGRSTAQRLKKINVNTIGELANSDVKFLTQYLGKAGSLLHVYANGLDNAPVCNADYKRELKSVGNSTTTPADMTNFRDVSATFHMLAASVSERLKKHKLKASVISIWVRDKDLICYEKQRHLFSITDMESVIYENAAELFKNSYDWHTSVRSVGIRCSELCPSDSSEQISIFDAMHDSKSDGELAKAVSDIRARYGSESIKKCAQLTDNNDQEAREKGRRPPMSGGLFGTDFDG